MLVQLEFLKLTSLIELPEEKNTIQLFWNENNSIETYSKFKMASSPSDPFKIARLVEFKRTNEFTDIGYLRVPIYRLSKIE